MKRTKEKLYKRLSTSRGRQGQTSANSGESADTTGSDSSSLVSSEIPSNSLSELQPQQATADIDTATSSKDTSGATSGNNSKKSTTDTKSEPKQIQHTIVTTAASTASTTSTGDVAIVTDIKKVTVVPGAEYNIVAASLGSEANDQSVMNSPTRPELHHRYSSGMISPTKALSRPQSRASSRGSSRASSRGPDRSTALKRTSHSYARLYSSTNLKELSSIDTGMESPKMNVKPSNVNDSTLLFRAGSKLWEESRETRGQNWLRDDYDSGVKSSDEEDSDEMTTDTRAGGGSGSRRPSYTRAGTFGSGNNSDAENETELVFYFRKKSSVNVDESDRDSQDSLENDAGSLGVYVLHAVDWILGIKQESPVGFAESLKHTNKRPLTQHEKMLLRDEEHYTPIDLAWVLALVAGSGFL